MISQRSIILSIAGSDSGGGAGIQADIKTISALGGYACTAITAVTAQNTQGVKAVYPMSVEALRQQLKAVGDDMKISAVKIGMVPEVAHIEVIAEAIDHYHWPHVVLDPVMVSTSGDVLVQKEVGRALIEKLFPLCVLLTPNIPEMEALSGVEVCSQEQMRPSIEALWKQGARSILLKGGHLKQENMTDVLGLREEKDSFLYFTSAQVHTQNLHGTGCTLSSAIATLLAQSFSLEKAIAQAKTYITRAIISGSNQIIGKGCGPVDHFVDYADICKR